MIMLRQSLLLCCILIGFATASKPLSILIVQPLKSTSHHLWVVPLLKGLLHKGHHVHIVSIHDVKIEDELGQNLTSVVFDDIMSKLSEGYNPNQWREFNSFQMIQFVFKWGIETCEEVIQTKAARELLETVKNVAFDVIVQDVTFNQCLYGLWEVAKGKPPVVGFIPFSSPPWFKDSVGGPNYPTLRSHYGTDMAGPKDFSQRLWNTVNYIFDDLFRTYSYMPKSQQLAERYVGHEIRPLHEIEKDISILLLNSHFSFEPAIPLLPNAIEVGGMHVHNSQAVIDNKIRNFLDGATNGAVMISLGTNVSWKSIELDKLKTVILALSKLKQRVLWKIELDIPLEIPDNVMVVKWAPQKDILAHKNIKAIWTHGGLLSTQEAIWQNVPIIGMPFFTDQRVNMQILVAKGAAVHVNVDTLTTQTILDAFDQVLYNESYAKNMKQLSSEFRDRPLSALDMAIWSIEYTVRHPKGTLASPIKLQSWIQYKLIDVYAFLLLCLVIILSIIFFTLKLLFNFYHRHMYAATKSHKSKKMKAS
ncbi:PREDICTED: UDP-glucuronosyltransferase 2B19-like [Dinoponera quadriceps]|uniref:UDP-glucuronosyltransferase 2B19-like n=1 Tax=Dinoponera quadriceps TaxID=609295 RepID=A0A6P3XAE7_DINQU|nr:PREDICTED: UDP-glucuronosyltransferase 2B19-like [Dinoponera quadriceps]